MGLGCQYALSVTMTALFLEKDTLKRLWINVCVYDKVLELDDYLYSRNIIGSFCKMTIKTHIAMKQLPTMRDLF